jgi:protein phosphatase
MPQAAVPELREVYVDAAGATSVGRERRRNEDQFLIATLHRNFCVRSSSISDEAGRWLGGGVEGTLLVVADGMGGHPGGDLASAVAVRAATAYVSSMLQGRITPRARPHADSLPGVREGLHSAFVVGDRAVRRTGRAEGSPDMGTTLTLAYVRFPLLYVAHVGDTRCYVWRAGELNQLTRDHTLAAELRERQGDDVVVDPSPWEHILSNALGGGDGVMARPDILRHELELDDVLLLCTDGLTKHLDDERIAQVLGGVDSAAGASVDLVAAADAAGGSDNITAVVGRIAPSQVLQ